LSGPNHPIYWCTAPRPESSELPCFAVGGSEGLATVTVVGTTANSQSVTRIKNVDVKAVEWLSSNVIMAGTRASQVLLYDMQSDGSVVRVQHRHGVHSLKKVDEWRIAVAGWGNNVLVSFYPFILTHHLCLIDSYYRWQSTTSATHPQSSEQTTPPRTQPTNEPTTLNPNTPITSQNHTSHSLNITPATKRVNPATLISVPSWDYSLLVCLLFLFLKTKQASYSETKII
jgi:hypothetical protein